MKKQIILVHGGDSFKSYNEYIEFLKTKPVEIKNFRPRIGWKNSIQDDLGVNFDVLQPEMPNRSNAKFNEWKIWFERMFTFLDNGVILVGHSLGGMFLAKYLAENNFPKRIAALHLVAPPHNRTEDVDSFLLPESLDNILKQTKNIFLYFSQDDELVQFSELDKYKKQLPSARMITFTDRGHFRQEHFPELIEQIKKY
jgi:hypothetical protein